MYKIRLYIVVKTSNQEKNQVFESYLYKEVDLPFLPTVGLKISVGDSIVVPPIESIIWQANGNYFVCQCADEIKIERLGKNEKYKWHATYIDDQYKKQGWILFDEYEDLQM
jgi:hypothetical protein